MGIQTAFIWSIILLHLIYSGKATPISFGLLRILAVCDTLPYGASCASNARCSSSMWHAKCSCSEREGYTGDPVSGCIAQDCLSNDRCNSSSACIHRKCRDVCSGSCGDNANCKVIGHVPVCTCQPGYTGDPFSSCRRFDPSELCDSSPCGANTICEVVDGNTICKCQLGFHGSALDGCLNECETDSECTPHQACLDFKCQDPCLSQCGEHAECKNIDHQAVCTCPKNYIGNPLVSCKPECYSDVDCPSDRAACVSGSCTNPCDGVCGTGADCNLIDLAPVCSCPKDMTGNPFVSCRPITAQDLCEPNPCGANAYCQPKFESGTSKERPMCFCHIGFIGDPITGCQQGECYLDADCPNNKTCIDYSCQDPCVGQCGVNAKCNSRNHRAVCTCPSGYEGRATFQCYASEAVIVNGLFGKRTLEELRSNQAKPNKSMLNKK